MEDDLRFVVTNQPEELVPDLIRGNLPEYATLVIEDVNLTNAEHFRGILAVPIVGQPRVGRVSPTEFFSSLPIWTTLTVCPCAISPASVPPAANR